jgi:hypothetical protein
MSQNSLNLYYFLVLTNMFRVKLTGQFAERYLYAVNLEVI